MKKTVFFGFSLIMMLPALAQEKSVFLPDVSILAPVLSKKDLDTNQILLHENNMVDGLRLAPEVFIKNYGPGASASLGIRGTASAHSTIVWKGIPIGNPMLAMVDLSILPGLLLENARIQTGGPALPGFSGNFGGYIGLKTGIEGNKNRVQIGSSIGSFGQFQNWFSSDQTLGKASVSLRAWHQLAENNFRYRFENKEKTQFHASKKDLGLIAELDLILTNLWHWKPAIWIQQSHRQIGPSVSEIYADALQADKSLRLVNHFAKNSANSEVEFIHAFAFQRLNYESQLIEIDSRNAVTENFIQARYLRKFRRFQLSLQGFQTISKTNSNNFAGKPEQWKSEIMGRSTLDLIPEIFQVQAQLHGLYYTHSQISNSGLFLLPSLQLQYKKPLPGKFSIGIFRKARVPGLNDLFWLNAGNASLKSENGWTLDLTWDKSLKVTKHLTFSTKSSVFSSNIEDYIQWVPVSGHWMPENLATVQIRGFSLNPTFEWTQPGFVIETISQIQFTQSIQTRTRFEGDLSVGNQMMYVPVWNSVFGVKTRIGIWEGLFWLEKTGLRYTDPANENVLPSYSLLNARVGFESKIKSKFGIKTYLEGLNLTSKSYQSVRGFPMPLHQFKFSIILSYQ